MRCKIHNVEMQQMWKKDDPQHLGESWWSHKTQEGSWCNGKEKKAYQPNQALQSTALAQLQASNARIEEMLKLMLQGLRSIQADVEPAKKSINDKPLPF